MEHVPDRSTWLDERIGGAVFRHWIREKMVPLHRHTIWYYFGGMTLFLFVIQAATGILLLLYYRPTAESAFESVQFIMAEVPFGWLVRSIHSWSANLMILVLFIHLASVYLTKAYRRPREMTWVSGVCLLLLALGFGFSGYLLPWNKLAFFATQVGTEIAGATPVIGSLLLKFLRGGENVTGATLTRFFGFHVAVLPALATLFLGIHILLVQLHGMSVPEGERTDRRMPFYPNFLLRDILGWLVALAVLAVLAALFPWDLGEKADPFAPAPQGIRPEWFFVWMFQTLKVFPSHIGIFEGEQIAILALGVIGLLLFAVPFLDTHAGRQKVARFFSILGWIFLVYFLFATASAYAASPQSAPQKDTCISCHRELDGDARRPVELFTNDIHRLRGLSCADCHGGDPTRGDDGDMYAAMDPSRGYVGAPKPSEVAAFCGRCHRRENTLFAGSPHHQPFADLGLAACITCHNNHDTAPADDRLLSVNGNGICKNCHAEGDEAFPKIARMQKAILGLRLQIDTTAEILGRAERAGMEISKAKFNLQEASDELIKARVSVHGFNPEDIEKRIEPAMKIATQAHRDGDRALEDLNVRRRGLGYSLIAIAITIVALFLKIREIDRRSK